MAQTFTRYYTNGTDPAFKPDFEVKQSFVCGGGWITHTSIYLFQEHIIHTHPAYLIIMLDSYDLPTPSPSPWVCRAADMLPMVSPEVSVCK